MLPFICIFIILSNELRFHKCSGCPLSMTLCAFAFSISYFLYNFAVSSSSDKKCLLFKLS